MPVIGRDLDVVANTPGLLCGRVLQAARSLSQFRPPRCSTPGSRGVLSATVNVVISLGVVDLIDCLLSEREGQRHYLNLKIVVTDMTTKMIVFKVSSH